MRNLLLLFLIGLMAHTTHAQKRTQDVIHLKNGSIIRNASGLKHLDSLIEVQTKDGSTIRFAASDLERIVREPVKPDFRTKGYFVGMEAGFGFGKTYELRNGQSAQATQKLQVQVVNGYWFTPRWAAGIGVGLDGYEHNNRSFTTMPVFVRLVSAPLTGRLSPVATLDLGHGWYSNKLSGGTAANEHNRGGLLFNPSAGFLARTSRKTSFLFTIGYRSQAYHYWRDDFESRTDNHVVFRRMSVRMGWMF